MNRLDYLKTLCECPSQDSECPYFDWKTHKCKMFVETNSHPQNECEDYQIGVEE